MRIYKERRSAGWRNPHRRRCVMPTPRPPHILVVDAQSDIFELLAPGLTEHRYRITHARDVAAAKDILSRAPVDLILVDTRLLNAVGTMLVGHAAFGVPLLPLPANHMALDEAVRSRLGEHNEMPSTAPLALTQLVKWVGDALRSTSSQ